MRIERYSDGGVLGLPQYRYTHKNGLTVLMCPMEGFAASCASFSANVGSVDSSFRFAGERAFTDLPAGIAHFLEHKMFECEDGDAFQRYSATGASANAYTSFEKTSYFFTCTQSFLPSLEILLDFVSHPYFTPESVQKEQGIIGQEIGMYDDNPDWRVFFNLLCGMYSVNPVRLDIAGTAKTIAEIDAPLLYRCYEAFYNPANMVLCAAGKIDCEEIADTCDRLLPDIPARPIERRSQKEPLAVAKRQITQHMEVAAPIFELGFKAPARTCRENALRGVVDEVLQDIICGEATDLYRELYDGGLINSAFGTEVLSGRDYLCACFGGESPDPEAAARRISARIDALRRDGIPQEDFLRCRKAAYGRYISMYCKPDSVAGLMSSAHFAGIEDICTPMDIIRSLTLNQANECLREDFNTEYCTLSAVLPAGKSGKER